MAEKVLVPLDGSELAARILTQVRRILLRKDAEVVLLRVVSDEEAGKTRALGRDPKATARRYVDGLRDVLLAQGAQASSRVEVGDPATKILEVGAEIEPSLVAMSTHGRSGIASLLRGSVAERVLRRSSSPLLLANPHGLEGGGEARMKRILVPLDGSEAAAEVLPLAVELAKLYEAELVLFLVVEYLTAPDTTATFFPQMSSEDALALLERFRGRTGGVPARMRTTLGNPALAILAAAKDEKADLVAMTTHGRTGISRWVFGSVAEHVVRHCPCPLLVERTSGLAEEPPLPEKAAERAGTGLARQP